MTALAAGAERTLRPRPLSVLAVAFALVSLSVGFGAVDLLSPWILHEGTQVSDVGYGTLAGLLIPAGLLAHARNPARQIAGLQQVGAAAVAYVAAGALTADRRFLLAGALVAGSCALLAVLHPVRRQLVVLPRRPSALLLLLAVAAWLPGWQYALHMAVNQRDNVLPADSHLGLGHWAALSAAAIATLLAALLAALRTSGSAIPAGTAVAAMLTWGITCLACPRSAGALGSAWAALAITWAAVSASPRSSSCKARQPDLRLLRVQGLY